MGGKHGTEQLQKVAVAAFEFGEVGYEISTDRGGLFSRAARALTLADDIASLLTLDIDQLKKEIQELDADDRAMVVKAVKDEFDIEDDGLELRVTESLIHGLNILQSVQELIKVHSS